MPSYGKRKSKLPYLYMAPAMVTILFVFLIPFIFSIVISFTSWDGINKNITFIGFQNFIQIFKEKGLGEILLNNLKYLIGLVFVQNLISVLLAVALNGKFRGRNVFRSIIFLPATICTVAVAFIWSFMYDPLNGMIPAVLKLLHIPILKDIMWLGNPNAAIYAVMFTSIWQWVGWNMVIYLAGLQSISGELYESADMDGSSVFQKFRYITLPMLAPAITINIISSSIGALKIFDLPYIMTGGGPGHSTESLAITIYQNAFTMSKMGYGTALSLVQFLFILVIAIIQLVYFRKREENIL